MIRECDILLLGSGFSASLLAMALQRQGRRVIMIESQKHPRFAIGESSTPLANLLLEEFAREYGLMDLLPLAKWGSWQRERSEIGCGLKRGFTFYHHRWGQRRCPDSGHSNELLVAASPNDQVADTHWYRPDFDQYLAQMAQVCGAELFESTRVESVDLASGGNRVVCSQGDQPIEIRARWVVDATGPRGCLSRLLSLGELPLPGLPETATLFAHFEGVARGNSISDFTSIGTPPYPPDDAAVHHVFEGGWMWILGFNNGRTSAGVVLTKDRAREVKLEATPEAWGRVLEGLPSVRDLFSKALRVTPFVYQSRMSYLSARGAGPGWVMMPSAMGFVDPLLSSGFPLTLLGVRRLASLFRDHWGQGSEGVAVQAYVERSYLELTRCASLIGALYQAMPEFERFVELTKLYFAAASFAETERRLGRNTDAAASFLLGHHPNFVTAMESCLALAVGSDTPGLMRGVAQAIESFDIAGLNRTDRAHWYPVDLEDLVRSASKLPATEAQLDVMLRSAGLGGLPQFRGATV